MIDWLIRVIMIVKIEIVSTSWVSMVTLDCWCVQLLLISFLCFYISTHFSLIVFFNLILLFAIFFLSILISEFSPFSYTLVCYKNVETIFTDRVRNVVITNSPDRDMIVADHMNQVYLSCVAEGNPSVSFTWCSKNQTWTISCQLKICWWQMTFRQIKVASMRVKPIILLVVKCIPWPKLSTLQ